MADLFQVGQTQLKQYRLAVTQRTIVTLTATSSAIDTQLFVYSNDRRVRHATDDDSLGGTNSRIIANLIEGSYLVMVVSKQAGVTGAFELKSAQESPRNCTVTDLTPGTDVQASFSASSCRGVDWAGNTVSADVQFQNRYRLRLDKESVVTSQLEPPAGLTQTISAETGTGAGFRGADRLVSSQLEGSYSIRVFSSQAGSYTLKTNREDLRSCPAKVLETGTPLDAAFAAESCRFLDVFIPSVDDSYVEVYRMAVASRQVVTVNQKSGDMDSFLLLLNARGQPLGVNDDAGPDTLDSQMVNHLPAGNYFLVAGQLDKAEGAYKLDATTEDPRPCNPRELQLNTAVDGTLAESGCRVLDAILFSGDKSIATAFKATLPSRQLLKLDANVGGRQQGRLFLVTPEARPVVAQSGDRDNNFALEVLLNAGEYLALLTSAETPRPSFVVRGSLRDRPSCPSTNLAFGDTVEGSLSASDCKLHEMALEIGIPTPAKEYAVEVASRGRLTLDINGAVPIIVAMSDPDDQIVGFTQRTTPGRLLFGGAVVAGLHKIYVSTPAASGTFTLRATLDSGAPAADVKAERDDDRWPRQIAPDTGRVRFEVPEKITTKRR